jgi:hypothetical protein
MSASFRVMLAVISTLAATLGPTSATHARSAAPGALAFRIDEGRNINSFLRAGPVAAHLLLRQGNEPRILVAFPAGNSGVGLWFEQTSRPVTWTLVAPPKAIATQDDKLRMLHGIEFEIAADAGELQLRAAVMSSVRVLRDYELLATAPAEVMVAPRPGAGEIAWARDRLDGAAGFRLSVDALGGSQVSARKFLSADGEPLRLRIRALTGEAPLRPLAAVLAPAAQNPENPHPAPLHTRDALAFLSYEDKFLAGSWRFNTYFGRDTLITALLLAPVLEPVAMESAIASVMERLAPNGEVAHEEDIGEFAVLRNAREGRGRIATPIFDYGMVDDDFLLAPLVARWLLDDQRGRARAKEFLAAKGMDGRRRGDALARNLLWIVGRTASFAADPRAANLVGLKPGRMTGNWRDSEQGLAGGRYAYDVNAALVPAALSAAERLAGSGLLDDILDEEARRELARARVQAQAWSTRAPALFAVEIPAERAHAEIKSYAATIGVAAEGGLRELGERPLGFHALSLDEGGRPIPILNSDEGFRLLLTEPTPTEMRKILVIMRPFPAGLLTHAGVVVANPALAGSELEGEFSRFAYHGTVIWSWQQALLAAGIDRQLRRGDLPEDTRAQLRQARERLWKVIDNARALRTSELWSWSYAAGRFHIEPFGRAGADADESNAAQLWSTVFLGLKRDTSPGN